MSSLEKLGEVHRAEVLVIGGGLAGAFAAIKAKEQGADRVLLVDKAKTGKSGCSAFAAGVLHIFVPEEDDFDAWCQEVVEQGCHLGDQEWMEVIIQESFDRVKEMDAWGVTFEKTPEGGYERKHMRGSAPGRPLKAMMFRGPQMMEAVAARAAHLGVQLMDRVMVVDLLVQDGQVVGALGFDTRSGEVKIFQAKATVVAAGGTAYKGTYANHKMQSGDSSAMFFRAGVTLSGMDLCSYNATAAAFDILGMNMFVALGGKFVNSQGEEFLQLYDPILGNRTLARIYAQAMALEVMAGRGPIYLDMTHFDPELVKKLKIVLPLIMKNFEDAGVAQGDRIIKRMEYVPSCMGTTGGGGGARTDLKCRTDLGGLYAAGDAAHRRGGGIGAMGVGALPFAAVSGARAGRYAAEEAQGKDWPRLDEGQIELLIEALNAPLHRKEGIEPDQVILALQETILRKDVFIITHEERLAKALAEVNAIAEEELPHLIAYDPHYLRLAQEAKNLVLTAQLWLTSARLRKESRGSLLRQDYPHTDNVNWLKWVVARNKSGSITLETEEIPFERYRFKPKREIFLAPMWQKASERGIRWA